MLVEKFFYMNLLVDNEMLDDKEDEENRKILSYAILSLGIIFAF